MSRGNDNAQILEDADLPYWAQIARWGAGEISDAEFANWAEKTFGGGATTKKLVAALRERELPVATFRAVGHDMDELRTVQEPGPQPAEPEPEPETNTSGTRVRVTSKDSIHYSRYGKILRPLVDVGWDVEVQIDGSSIGRGFHLNELELHPGEPDPSDVSRLPHADIAQRLYEMNETDYWESDERVYLENEVCQRLKLPLDMTDRGLSQEAAKAIDNYIEYHRPEL